MKMPTLAIDEDRNALGRASARLAVRRIMATRTSICSVPDRRKAEALLTDEVVAGS